MKDILLAIVGLVAVGFIIYSMYYIGKTVSYSFFYESMVEQSIKDMVKPSCLGGK